MNATTRYAALVLAVAGSSVFASGCFVSKCPDTNNVDGGFPTTDKDNCIQLEPGKFYEGTAVTASQAWASGGTVTIRNGNGGTTVKADGAAGVVVYSAVPFDYEKADSTGQQAAVTYISQMSPPGIGGDGTSVNVNAEGTGGHGYHLTVTLPSNFDGTIDAQEGNGDITVSPAGAAKQVTANAPQVGAITVAGVSGAVSLTTGNGAITVSGLPNGGTMATDLGDVTLTIQGATNLAIQATASETVDVTLAQPPWTVGVAAANSKTASIGTATPILTVSTKLGKVTIGGS